MMAGAVARAVRAERAGGDGLPGAAERQMGRDVQRCEEKGGCGGGAKVAGYIKDGGWRKDDARVEV